MFLKYHRASVARFWDGEEITKHIFGTGSSLEVFQTECRRTCVSWEPSKNRRKASVSICGLANLFPKVLHNYWASGFQFRIRVIGEAPAPSGAEFITNDWTSGGNDVLMPIYEGSRATTNARGEQSNRGTGIKVGWRKSVVRTE